MHSSFVQIEHRPHQLFLGKAVTRQIEPRLARGAACFQEHILRLRLNDQLWLVFHPPSLSHIGTN